MANARCVLHNTHMQPTATTYSELRQAYDVLNAELFSAELPPCLLTLQREKRTYGYFSRARFGTRTGETTDEIALNPEYFAVVPLLETLQTLGHEMVHLWQAHFGKPGRGRYHNAEWADKMEAIGLMPSSTGRPGGRRVGDSMADYMIPGGRFERAVARLVSERGFSISWYDLQPARMPLYESTSPVEAASLPPAALSKATDDGLVVRVAGRAPAAGDGAVPDRSNRVKWSCPGCRASAWGKPGLRLGCIPCGLPLLAAASSSTTAATETFARRR